MTLIELPEARADIDRHWHYIASGNLEAADRFLEACRNTYEQIRKQPGIGHQERFRRAAGVRSWRVEGFRRYLVFYRVGDQQIEIARVLQGMQNLPRYFRR